MIAYHKNVLSNGLRVIIHEDAYTPLVAVNLLYDVGSRDEHPKRTGLAHLFEHLMFEGSIHIPDFDRPLHKAGGEANAFTSSDITNYYDILPACNIETAFWLESDRMLQLNLNQESVSVQKGVVCEEFKETHLNQPYGDAWHHLRALAYDQHPYRYPVIGKELAHIEQVTLAQANDFYYTHYRPNRAILTIAGGVKADEVFPLVDKWFGNIVSGNGQTYTRSLPKEAQQTDLRTKTVEADVPLDAIYIAFPMYDRFHKDYHTADLLTEILSGGSSGRLHQVLVKKKQLFVSLSATMTGSFDQGLLVVSGKLSKGITLETAEQAIWEELAFIKATPVLEEELEKTINKVESAIAYSELTIGSKAFNLAYFELMGNIEEVNYEMQKYVHITVGQIQRVANELFRKENCSVLYYKSKQEIRL